MSFHQFYYPPLFEGQFFHIYNRGNNGENLFYQERNYFYFLKQYDLYLSDYLETYAYCLLPNHFHLLVRVRNFDELTSEKRTLQYGNKQLKSSDTVISELFRRLFSSYARAIKKQESRTGSLFQKNFKRKQVISEAYFTALIAYIHRNPQTHKIFDNFENYPHSSYKRILLPVQTRLMKEQVLNWFGGNNAYEVFHQNFYEQELITDLIVED